MNLWEERAARNEALFREVNEQVDSIADRQGGGAAEELLFVCECSDDRCTERVAVPRPVYEAVRTHPRRFLVVPGHDQDVEHVVEREARYAIVEKEGRAGEVAEQTDPRG
jgi:hypothetical protein